jgi:hypothetical protein
MPKYLLVHESGKPILEADTIEALFERMQSLVNAKVVDENGHEVHPMDRRPAPVVPGPKNHGR